MRTCPVWHRSERCSRTEKVRSWHDLAIGVSSSQVWLARKRLCGTSGCGAPSARDRVALALWRAPPISFPCTAAGPDGGVKGVALPFMASSAALRAVNLSLCAGCLADSLGHVQTTLTAAQTTPSLFPQDIGGASVPACHALAVAWCRHPPSSIASLLYAHSSSGRYRPSLRSGLGVELCTSGSSSELTIDLPLQTHQVVCCSSRACTWTRWTRAGL